MKRFQGHLSSEKLQGLATDADNLVVRIFSFSFHQSLPKDEPETAAASSLTAAASPILAAKSASKL